MRVRFQTYIPHLLEQFTKSLRAFYLYPDPQCVNEESDQPLDLRPIPVRDVGPDRYILLPAVTAHDYIEAREKRHKHGRSISITQFPQRLRQLSIDHKLLSRPSV